MTKEAFTNLSRVARPVRTSATNLAGTLILAGALSACGGGTCVTPPCPEVTALVITVTSATTGNPIATAVLAEHTPSSAQISCNATCSVQGGPGQYTFTLGAPGFDPVDRTVQVTGSTPKCGCETADTQHLAIALAPSTKQ